VLGVRTAVFLCCCALAALTVGCGGDDPGERGAAATATSPATTVVVTTTVTVTTSSTAERTTTSSSDDDGSLEGFRSPSGNISCVAALGAGSDSMRCIVGEMTNEPPPRPESCEFDWGPYFELGPTGPGTRACVSDTLVPDEGFVVLPYGSTWKRGPFTCRSRPDGVRCTNTAGHGLFLSRERQRVF
jgi:uncharacterized protein DUF6636